MPLVSLINKPLKKLCIGTANVCISVPPSPKYSKLAINFTATAIELLSKVGELSYELAILILVKASELTNQSIDRFCADLLKTISIE